MMISLNKLIRTEMPGKVAENTGELEKPYTQTKKRPYLLEKRNKKKLRQSGQQYIASNGKIQRAKFIKDCKRDHTQCCFKCKLKISIADQETLHKQCWILNDQEKRLFYSQTTIVENKKGLVLLKM